MSLEKFQKVGKKLQDFAIDNQRWTQSIGKSWRVEKNYKTLPLTIINELPKN
jgi:arginine decarboxylase-like protein